jgi:hypothetical protein
LALTVDEISALTENLWVPLIADNVMLSNPLMARLWQRGPKVQGGVRIRAPLMFARVGAAGAIQGFDTMTIDADDQFTAADFEWKEYYAAIVLSHREMFQNSGEPEQIDHLSAKSQASEMTLRDLMGTGLFSDGVTNTKLIDGLNAAVNITGTYPSGPGGINRAVETWWQAGARSANGGVGNLTTTNGLVFLQTGVGLVTQQPNSPTMIVVSQAIFNVIMANFLGTGSGSGQQWEDPGLASLGFETILFRRIPIVVDSHSTADSTWFLNENFLQLYTLRDENFKFEPYRKPINQKVFVGYIFWTGNLICNNPRFQGVFTDTLP